LDHAIRLRLDSADILTFSPAAALRATNSETQTAHSRITVQPSGSTQNVRLHPDDGKNFFNRGAAHEAADNLDDALADYNEALPLNPDRTDARSSRDEIRKSIAKRSKS